MLYPRLINLLILILLFNIDIIKNNFCCKILLLFGLILFFRATFLTFLLLKTSLIYFLSDPVFLFSTSTKKIIFRFKLQVPLDYSKKLASSFKVKPQSVKLCKAETDNPLVKKHRLELV